MGSAIVFTLVYFALQVALLVACMHIAGRKLGLDFGPFWSAVGKASVVLLVGAILIDPLAANLGLFVGFLFLVAGYAVAFKFAFGLEFSEAALFTLIYITTIIMLYFVLVLLVFAR